MTFRTRFEERNHVNLESFKKIRCEIGKIQNHSIRKIKVLEISLIFGIILIIYIQKFDVKKYIRKNISKVGSNIFSMDQSRVSLFLWISETIPCIKCLQFKFSKIITYFVELIWRSYCSLLAFREIQDPYNILCKCSWRLTNRLFDWHVVAHDHCRNNCVL